MDKTNTNPALHWIDGEWVDSEKHRDSMNPATGETIGSYADATPEEAERAVNAAVRAFRNTGWKDDRQLRARVLNRMADRFEARSEDLIQMLALENGKILPETRFEVGMVPRSCATGRPRR